MTKEYEYIKIEKRRMESIRRNVIHGSESSTYDYDLREELKEALEEIQTIKKPLDLTKEEIKLLSTMVKEEIEIASMGEAENILSKLNFLFLKLVVNK